MHTRFFIGGTVFGGAFTLLWEAFDQTLNGRFSDLLLNLGTELIGIGITVLIIDIMLEKRRLNDEAKRIATNVLHDLDHHVWVWQGGARGFDLPELLALLNNASDQSPLPPFTQNLFLNLGSRSNNTLRNSAEAVAVSPKLKEGLITLSELSCMRDKDQPLPSGEVIATLNRALPSLALAAGLPMPESDELPPSEYRGTSEEEQEWRHYGHRQYAAPTDLR